MRGIEKIEDEMNDLISELNNTISEEIMHQIKKMNYSKNIWFPVSRKVKGRMDKIKKINSIIKGE